MKNMNSSYSYYRYVAIRECNRCGKREHHMMPKLNGDSNDWREFKFKVGDKIYIRL